MDFNELIESHIEGERRHHHRRAARVGRRRHADGHPQVRRSGPDHRLRGEADAANGSPRSAVEHAAGVDRRRDHAPRSRSSRRWASTSSTARSCCEILDAPGVDFGKEIIPKAITTHAVSPYVFRGYWADVGTIDSFYDANIELTRRGAPFNFFHPRWPIYTHPRFLPATRAFDSRHRIRPSSPKAAIWIGATIASSVVGIRTHDQPGAHASRDRSCSARTSTRKTRRPTHPARRSAATSCSIA